MEKEIELKALEAIENIPMPPKTLPYVIDEGPMYIPKEITEYLDRIGVKPELDKNGQISVPDYLNLLKETGIMDMLEMPITHYKVI